MKPARRAPSSIGTLRLPACGLKARHGACPVNCSMRVAACLSVDAIPPGVLNISVRVCE
ncbi:MAG TPA: hypothetical protein VM846_05460 [Vicinamibacterales bacterium]|nr:hypothetical protein [Vicinamibacterales bacterium]